MLAYYVEWHMRQKLKSILFDDHDKAAADAARPSVAKAKRSEAASARPATAAPTMACRFTASAPFSPTSPP
jgi:hypothetical protein